ncbi:hypothetical protein [Kitasatospora herbaricolor]|uniref:hypothetical protein n=1 Tax=Kitasatospora herbaricolor TaxID=68217 RepID=UPI0036DC482E
MNARPDERQPSRRRADNSRRVPAGVLVTAALLVALATGCGIRPTAVPVDAGGPASRTACPSPVQVPTAAATPSVTPSVQRAPAVVTPSARAAGTGRSAAASPAASPSGSASPSPGAVPTDSVFSALPSPSAGGSGRPGCP